MTDDETKILDFKGAHPRHSETNHEAVRLAVGLTEARFFQRLHELVHRHDVVAEYPQTCGRVQRQMAAVRAGERGVRGCVRARNAPRSPHAAPKQRRPGSETKF